MKSFLCWFFFMNFFVLCGRVLLNADSYRDSIECTLGPGKIEIFYPSKTQWVSILHSLQSGCDAEINSA